MVGEDGGGEGVLNRTRGGTFWGGGWGYVKRGDDVTSFIKTNTLKVGAESLCLSAIGLGN